jgi:predicted site-specific integrase-resolvase
LTVGAAPKAPATSCVELTVKEYADRERVSERTVWTWLAKGAVKFRKTPGGGIRVVSPSAPLKNTEDY